MRLTLWQQFSSNHSASFMLVGKFETYARAEAVAEELRSMLREIGQWWEQFPLDAQVRLHARDEMTEKNQLTPPEEKFRAKYKDEWKGNNSPLDLIHGQDAAQAIRTWNELVIVEAQSDTWDGPQPFKAILKTLGAEVTAECEIYDTYFAVNLTCNAPDEVTAENMVADTKVIEPRPGLKSFVVSTFYPVEGRILREGRQVTYHHYQLLPSIPIYESDPEKHIAVYTGKSISFEEQLQRLIDYVGSFGCTDIQYTFVEAPYPKD